MSSHDERAIAADHPSLPGHFPGNPLVPGVVILDEVIATARSRHPGLTVSGLRQVKFVRPLRPGEPLRIELADPADGRLRFHCRNDHGDIALGVLQLAADA